MIYRSFLSKEDAAWGEKEVIKFRWVLIAAIFGLIGYIYIAGNKERAFISMALSLIYILYNSIIHLLLKKVEKTAWISYVSSTIDITILSLHIFNYSYYFKPVAVSTAPSLFLYPILIMLSVLRYDGKLVIFTTGYIILCSNIIFYIRFDDISKETIQNIASGGPEGAFYRSVYFGLMGYFMFSIPKMINRLVERQNQVNSERREIEIKLALEIQRKEIAMQNLHFEQEFTEQLNSQNRIIEEQNKTLEQLNHTKDKLFSIIGHDLRTPLSLQSSLSEYLIHDIKEVDKEMLYKSLVSIHKTANNGLDMLSNLMDWSRSQSNMLNPNPKLIKINHCIRHVIELFSEFTSSKLISITNKVNENCYVYADEQMFETILRNILSNAIKFTKNKGSILVNSQTYDNNTCCITIEDNGIGMTENELSDLFSIHKTVSSLGTNNEKGTGLGLMLCKEMIDINKGKINVKSSKGKGTKFIIHLPSSKHD